MVWILEKLLTFFAWYRKGAPYKNWSPSPEVLHAEKEEGITPQEWQRRKEHRLNNDKSCQSAHAEREIRKLVGAIVKFLPRTEGLGWHTQKTHEITHFVRQMSEFGAGMNFDCGVWESLLKFVATKPGRLVRKSNAKNFITALNRRLTESKVLCRAFEQLDNRGNSRPRCHSAVHDINHIHDADFGNNFAHENFEEEQWELVDEESLSSTSNTTTNVSSEWKNSCFFEVCLHSHYKQNKAGQQVRAVPLVRVAAKHIKEKSSVQVHPLIMSWFCRMDESGNYPEDRAWLQNVREPMQCYTECIRDGITYRAHPSFHGEPWHDWAMVKWADFKADVKDKSSLHHPQDQSPSKILTFFQHPFEVYPETGKPKMKALVHAASRPLEDEYSGFSNLCEVWEMEYNELDRRKTDQWGNGLLRSPRVECIDVDSLEVPVMMHEEEVGVNEVETDRPSASAKKDRTVTAFKKVTRNAILVRPFDTWAAKFLPDFTSQPESVTSDDDVECSVVATPNEAHQQGG